MSQDKTSHTCPACGAMTRERLLMKFVSVVLLIVEALHHNNLF